MDDLDIADVAAIASYIERTIDAVGIPTRNFGRRDSGDYVVDAGPARLEIGRDLGEPDCITWTLSLVEELGDQQFDTPYIQGGWQETDVATAEIEIPRVIAEMIEFAV